jgi:hypothetical protein
MLVDGIDQHASRSRKYELFVRLNVFSDIPWELVFPELFAHFSDLTFYDYTKVPGRVTPPNYDLTFSYSGINEAYMDYEIRRGRRVAMVFLSDLPRLSAEKRPRGYGLPKKFLNLNVVDGDVSDVRPRDEAPSIVGLRWKSPHGQDKALERAEERSFVVPVREIDGVLVASQSARQEPIADPDNDPDAEN